MIQNGKELAQAARAVAENYKTIYAKGCFGWPMMQSNKDRAILAYAYNAKEERAAIIQSATEDTFAFDCVCFIKALLWGWEGNSAHVYGGATYVSGGVPDKNANQMIALCQEVSKDFSNIQAGEVVWKEGHIGIYIGNGLAVECTPKWAGGVQVTAVHNISKQEAYPGRKWTSHGKLPYISYEETFDLTLPVLRKGLKEERVKALQMLLIGWGYSCGEKGVDGSFGGATRAAVEAFQEDKGLQVNGIVSGREMALLLGESDE